MNVTLFETPVSCFFSCLLTVKYLRSCKLLYVKTLSCHEEKLFTACRKGLLLAGGVCLLSACGNSGSGNSLLHAESVAYFDSFYYQGEDDYYKENPLPGADYFYNPVLSGWYSDPSICKNDKGDYFLVTSTFCYYPGVPIFHSRDLVNWQQIGYVLNRPEQLVNMEGQHVSGGIFAPDITYNPITRPIIWLLPM